MFINKTPEGFNNLCGANIARYRKAQKLSQRELADRLQLRGLNLDKNAVQRMESRQRFVTDIELQHIAGALSVSLETLLEQKTGAAK